MGFGRVTAKWLRLLVVVLILAWPGAAQAAITVVPWPGAAADEVGYVQQTVDSFNNILAGEMKVTLTRDVKVFVCGDEAAYATVLETQFGMAHDAALREAKVSGGMSTAGGPSQVVAVKFDPLSASYHRAWAYTCTGHELTHQVQRQLSGDRTPQTLYWLKEGSADLVGALVGEKMGYQSMEKWKFDRVNILRLSPGFALPTEIAQTNLDKWTGLMEGKRHPYEVADLMVLYLLTVTPKNGYEAIADYYRLAANGMSDADNFRRAFGISLNDFNAGFKDWLAGQMAAGAQVEVNTGGRDDAGRDVEKAMAASQDALQSDYGSKVASSQRFILANDKAAYSAALRREFGLTAEDAAAVAKKTVWRYSGGTVVVDVGSMPSSQTRYYFIARMTQFRWLDQQPAVKILGNAAWLKYGLTTVFAAQVTENAAIASPGTYRKFWVAALARADGLPSLAELQTEDDWGKAVARYGLTVVNSYAAMAVRDLVTEKGYSAIPAYFAAAKETGDAGAAFTQAFGRTTAAFFEECNVSARGAWRR